MDKKVAFLAVFLLVFSASCKSGPLKDIRLGKTFGVIDNRDILIHGRPSLEAETFLLEEPETFYVEDVVCAEGMSTGNCYFDLIASKDRPELARVAFYRVRFESGKEGYVNALYFYPKKSTALISEEEAGYLKTTVQAFIDDLRTRLRELESSIEAGAKDIEDRRLKAISAAPWPEEEKSLVVERKTWVGMAADQLLLSKGPPASVRKTVTEDGASEQWFYKDITYGLKDGRVVEWVTTTPGADIKADEVIRSVR